MLLSVDCVLQTLPVVIGPVVLLIPHKPSLENSVGFKWGVAIIHKYIHEWGVY